jgi:hypothetical protein
MQLRETITSSVKLLLGYLNKDVYLRYRMAFSIQHYRGNKQTP